MTLALRLSKRIFVKAPRWQINVVIFAALAILLFAILLPFLMGINTIPSRVAWFIYGVCSFVANHFDTKAKAGTFQDYTFFWLGVGLFWFAFIGIPTGI